MFEKDRFENLDDFKNEDAAQNQDDVNQDDNYNEEVPVIIYKKKKTYADYDDGPYDGYDYKPVYKWNLHDEEKRLNARVIKKAKKNLGLKILAVSMSVMFMFSAIMSALLLTQNLNGSETASSGNNFEQLVISIPSHADTDARELTVSEVIAKIKPSVVTIEAEVEINRIYYWGRGREEDVTPPDTRTGVGTGFILSEDGYIATNYHVIEDASSLSVLLGDGRRYPADIIGGDEAADIAIIKINAKDLPVAELGNSDAAMEGEFVVAIGSPGGVEFAGSSTFGIISGTDRDIEVSRGRNMTLLQTDAAINPGNSGGPLVNMRGQVIGINTLKLASNLFTSTLYEGMGFAIPITLAVDTFNEILANPGDIIRHRAYSEADNSSVSFGISGRTVDEAEIELYDVPAGVVVDNVTPNGACGRAGIISGDIIIALDGERVEDFEKLVELKHNYKPDDEAVVTVYRYGEELEFKITFDERN